MWRIDTPMPLTQFSEMERYNKAFKPTAHTCLFSSSLYDAKLGAEMKDISPGLGFVSIPLRK
jgi:hypothetical protein